MAVKLRNASIIALMMEAAIASETSVIFYEITRRNIPDVYHFIPAVV